MRVKKPTSDRRITVLYSELAGYTIACLKYLAVDLGVRLQLVHWRLARDAPFSFESLSWLDERLERSDLTLPALHEAVARFSPQALYLSGWMDRGYLSVARAMRKKGSLVIAGMDAQWRGSAWQRARVTFARHYLNSSIDVMWVPGDRQVELARRLGYNGGRRWHGLYSCDVDAFGFDSGAVADEKGRCFLFVGRYSESKGLDTMLSAYSEYRQQTKSPWPLLCAGKGPLSKRIDVVEGASDLGFLQPAELAHLLRSRRGVFVLPSISEPWGVVIHEAVAAGWPVVCSDACGAGVHLVQDSFNGFIHSPGDSEHLRRIFMRLSSIDESALRTMETNSLCLASQFSPSRWAQTFYDGVSGHLGICD